jgi:hypothetical protein
MNVKISYYYAFLFINTSINTSIYIINMADPTIIEYSKCYIHKPRPNFIKDGLLKKILKLWQLYRLKARLLYILLLLTFLGL